MFEFKCDKCNTRVDKLFATYERAVEAEGMPCACKGRLERQVSAPGFVVNGFSQKNCYNGGQTYEQKSPEKDMRVTVTSH
jgi:predicted nucleic acid-binding Zn ribbon protein